MKHEIRSIAGAIYASGPTLHECVLGYVRLFDVREFDPETESFYLDNKREDEDIQKLRRKFLRDYL